MVTAPFRISVYDKDFAPLDWVGAPLEVHATVRNNAASAATLVLDADDEQVGVLTAAGARVVIEYFHDPADPLATLFLLSGPVGERSGSSGPAGTRTFEVTDDWTTVFGMLGWPNPTGDASEQGDDDAYYTLTGSAEYVLKSLVSVNATRLGLPVTVATDLDRGSDISISTRMHRIGDRLFPAVTQAGLCVTVRQDGAGLVVDCHEPVVLVDPLTEASGVVESGSFTAHPPAVTRATVGGGGEGTSRVFRVVVDTVAEAEWAMVREAFVDARDTTDTAILDARAQQAITEGAAKTSLSATLSETDDFRYGVTCNVGDVVAVQLLGVDPITDTVTEAQIDWTPRGGLDAVPRVGDTPASFEEIAAAALERVAARTRDQDARS